jgi:hypothetical protein
MHEDTAIVKLFNLKLDSYSICNALSTSIATKGHHMRDTAKTVTFSLMLTRKAPETVHKRLTVSVAPQHYT